VGLLHEKIKLLTLLPINTGHQSFAEIFLDQTKGFKIIEDQFFHPVVFFEKKSEHKWSASRNYFTEDQALPWLK
jgi:hypothetical protein